MNDPTDQSLARDTGLFLVLLILVPGLIVVLVNGPTLPGSTSAMALTATFYLALFIHVGFTIYDGSFSALRTVTWLLLIGAWAGSELATFSRFTLPWGQFASWLTTVPLIGEMLAGWFRGNTPSMFAPALPLLVLSLDIIAMHYDDWRKCSLLQIVVFPVAVGAAAIVLGLALDAGMNPSASNSPDFNSPGFGPDSFPILPPWYVLPFYTLLRAVPNKLGGVLLMIAAMLIPMIWPWMRTDLLRKGPMRRAWTLFCLALAAVWIALGYLGSRPPEGASLAAAQALAVLYFAFFLIVPPVLRKIPRKIAG
jgi:quinol-cytochrome oxidoreductase complex cytochrome b subunit